MAVASEMFKKANRVTRLDKALILGFMAGYRDNPRPNAENVITIKLNEAKVSDSVGFFKVIYDNVLWFFTGASETTR